MATTLTPVKAIRKYCLNCSGGSFKEVEKCVISECELYEYRYGKRPVKEKNQTNSNTHQG